MEIDPPLSYRRILPTEPVAQLQNVSFRPKGLPRLPRLRGLRGLRGEIPCSTRLPKLYMGFLLLSVVEMTTIFSVISKEPCD